MLIEFSVGNYKSFRDVVSFNMTAEKIKAKDEEVNENNTFEYKDGRLLKSAIIYGANASGKSNFLDAFGFFRAFILHSTSQNSEEKIDLQPFILNSTGSKNPSYFEVVFMIDSIRYRYGFEADNDKIHREWLWSKDKRETELFWREDESIEINKNGFKEGKGLESRTRKNALFLSVVDQFNGEIAQLIIKWFNGANVISGIEDKRYLSFTVSEFEKDPSSRKKIVDFMLNMDLGITDIKAELQSENMPASLKMLLKTADDIPKDVKQALENDPNPTISSPVVSFVRSGFDKNKNKIFDIEFDFDVQESEGTKKIFALAGPILNTLSRGSILLIDELDARLHPIMTRRIVKLFNSKEDNPNNAQLIFATHDTNLLDNTIFRRDQIWFAEKDEFGSTDLYSLSDYKDVRNDALFGRDYLSGKYGAIPYIGTFQF